MLNCDGAVEHPTDIDGQSDTDDLDPGDCTTIQNAMGSRQVIRNAVRQSQKYLSGFPTGQKLTGAVPKAFRPWRAAFDAAPECGRSLPDSDTVGQYPVDAV